MAADEALARLEQTLGELGPTLSALADLLTAQRQAVVDGNLDGLAALTATQEELSSRLAQLERRRETLQQSLELASGVRGLREIAGLRDDDQDRARFLDRVDELRHAVVRLQREQQRSAALLSGAIEFARRSRLHLERLSGARPAYGPIPLHPRGDRDGSPLGTAS